MKLLRKVGVTLLSLLLFAVPIMACTLPAMAMTMAERECCKHMAQECGKTGMPQSHSCCQTATVPDHLPAIKISPDVNLEHPALVLLYALPPSPTVAMIAGFSSSLWAADIHSPPVSPPVAICILRI
jgi:hypothetical protein